MISALRDRSSLVPSPLYTGGHGCLYLPLPLLTKEGFAMLRESLPPLAPPYKVRGRMPRKSINE